MAQSRLLSAIPRKSLIGCESCCSTTQSIHAILIGMIAFVMSGRLTPSPGTVLMVLILLSTAIASSGRSLLPANVSPLPLRLPPLEIAGQAARAHTQGLEVVRGDFYVTARREDMPTKRALLLRLKAGGTQWDAWDITPTESQAVEALYDHPGGMQSDGRCLWIPIAQSNKSGRSVIRAFPLSGMIPGQRLKHELEIPVNDHIGAIAVDQRRKWVYGASWDTELVYIWNHTGSMERTLSWWEMENCQLGRVSGTRTRDGLRVQDWKAVGKRLFASGLIRRPTDPAGLPESLFVSFERFASPHVNRVSRLLSKINGIELANEAMAVADRTVYFLPEDLGESNRVFRIPLADLTHSR